ncbi:hypothetical protein VTJ83DRAFT_385 [Remersonia thermophila]|uniref:Uncharacterized protein n=1 Tax=Remersonia thermophila TaxID=72144 RepID=A0ABR4DKX0_9PEZI
MFRHSILRATDLQSSSRGSLTMAYNHNPYHPGDCYPPPPASTRQLSNARLSHSTPASSAPYASTYPAYPATHHAMYSTGPDQQVLITRTLSPPSATFGSASTSSMMYSKGDCQALVHELSYASVTQPLSLPSQLLQAQAHVLPPPSQSLVPCPSLRPVPRPMACGDYQASLSQQPLELSHSTYDRSPFSSSTVATYQSATVSSLHKPASSKQPDRGGKSRPRTAEEGWMKNQRFNQMMSRLPPEVIQNIRTKLGYRSCWPLVLASRWFNQHFNPDHPAGYFTKEERFAGLLEMEKWGVYGNPDPNAPRKRKAKEEELSWLACYHCLRPRSLQYFERYKHTNLARRADAGDDGAKTRRRLPPAAATRRQSPYSPPTSRSSSASPPANPHYDPSLTRSSLQAARHARMPSPAGSSSSGDSEQGETRLEVRQKKTYSLRRFCIDCGLRLGIYEPGDLVEVHRPPEDKPNDAIWVCGCYELKHRADEAQCRACGHNCPFSTSVVAVRR